LKAVLARRYTGSAFDPPKQSCLDPKLLTDMKRARLLIAWNLLPETGGHLTVSEWRHHGRSVQSDDPPDRLPAGVENLKRYERQWA
jgi:hypothetical protein